MMAKRHLDALIEDMLRCLDKIERYTQGLSRDQILSDDKTLDALLRNVEVLGEIANQLGPTIWEQFPELPWREMIGMRNKLIHDYSGINLDLFIDTVEDDIPPLKGQLQALLKHVLHKVDDD